MSDEKAIKTSVFSPKALTATALLAAVLCILGPISFAVGPIPLSLGTLGIYLAAVLLPWKNALAAILVYLLLGMAGLPVFTGFSGGLMKLAGPTGGYLIGYLPCVFISSFATQKRNIAKTRIGQGVIYIVSMVIGTLVLYGFGSAWYMISTGSSLISTLLVCVAPFLPGDALKIAAAFSLGYACRKRINML